MDDCAWVGAVVAHIVHSHKKTIVSSSGWEYFKDGSRVYLHTYIQNTATYTHQEKSV